MLYPVVGIGHANTKGANMIEGIVAIVLVIVGFGGCMILLLDMSG